jgi:hypothetical protein
LFEQVAQTLDVNAAFDRLREVEVPDFEGDGVGEEVETSLVDLYIKLVGVGIMISQDEIP